jgi:hypothetical protein
MILNGESYAKGDDEGDAVSKPEGQDGKICMTARPAAGDGRRADA